MLTTTRHNERALRSVRRVSVVGSACATVKFAETALVATTNLSGNWYQASPVALRHDIAKAGSPRGSS